MNVTGKIDSGDKSKNVDCFGIGVPYNHDHIYPDSKGGSDNDINKQILSKSANDQKKDLTKGKIGSEGRFSILKQTDKDDRVYGIMFIRHKDGKENNGKEVTPIR